MRNTNVMQSAGQITSVKTIADRLKEERSSLSWSQLDLAKAAGVSQGTIGNIESGVRKQPRQLLKIAAALKVRPEWLQDGSEPREPPTHTAQASQQVGDFGQVAVAGAAHAAPSLAQALPVVLDALARAAQRAELRQLLPMLVDTDAPAYRQRLAELLSAAAGNTAPSGLAETNDFAGKPAGTGAKAGSPAAPRAQGGASDDRNRATDPGQRGPHR